MSKKPGLTVLAGPTAVGKGTVSTYIRDNYPEVWLSVSATTRAPRPGEVDGVHYFFKTKEEFEQLIAAGELLEWAVVHGQNTYGTLKSTVNQAISEGRSVLLEIDLQGARQVKAAVPDAQFVFLAPGLGAQGATPADLRATFGAAYRYVLGTSSRDILSAGPDLHGLREAALRTLDGLRAE